MRFYLFSCEDDTLTGMRLAGIEGEKVLTKQDFEAATEKVLSNKEIGLLLITSGVGEMFPQEVLELKKQGSILVTQVPDINSNGSENDSITRYVRDAIGIKI